MGLTYTSKGLSPESVKSFITVVVCRPHVGNLGDRGWSQRDGGGVKGMGVESKG